MSKFGDPDWFSAENLAKRASAAADVENRAWGNLGEMMRRLYTDPGTPAAGLPGITEGIMPTADKLGVTFRTERVP